MQESLISTGESQSHSKVMKYVKYESFVCFANWALIHHVISQPLISFLTMFSINASTQWRLLIFSRILLESCHHWTLRKEMFNYDEIRIRCWDPCTTSPHENKPRPSIKAETLWHPGLDYTWCRPDLLQGSTEGNIRNICEPSGEQASEGCRIVGRKHRYSSRGGGCLPELSLWFRES